MAYTNPLHRHPDAKELRREAGVYLKRLREAAGHTQSQLARALGLEYYTMVSHAEAGRARIPPNKMRAWAQELGIEPQEFVRSLMRFYDPHTWKILFGSADTRTLGFIVRNDEGQFWGLGHNTEPMWNSPDPSDFSVLIFRTREVAEAERDRIAPGDIIEVFI